MLSPHHQNARMSKIAYTFWHKMLSSVKCAQSLNFAFSYLILLSIPHCGVVVAAEYLRNYLHAQKVASTSYCKSSKKLVPLTNALTKHGQLVKHFSSVRSTKSTTTR